MPMDSKVAAELAKEQVSPFHSQMLQDSKQLILLSRKQMATYYPRWDHNDLTYNITKPASGKDEQDRKAKERKEPEKTVIPVSYAQVQTFVSFCFTLFTQRERMFELQGMNRESQVPAKLGEAILARDLQYNKFDPKLYQFLLDIGRFGVGIFKTSWARKTQRVWMDVEKDPFATIFGVKIGGGTTRQQQEVVKYLGNMIFNISPYRFFPDTRMPMGKFQDGEFCGSEDIVSYVSLKQAEKDGDIAGTQFLQPMNSKMLEDRGATRLGGPIEDVQGSPGLPITHSMGQTKGTYIRTEIQRTIIPSEYKINGEPLGKEDYPVKYLVEYVNDSRVVRCEPLNYAHDQFTYDVAEFNPDMHRYVSSSLSDSIDALQNIISWFINSRITSVRKVISNSLVVDPEGIEMKDLQDRNPVIRLKPTAANRGVDKFIKQLEIKDVTTNHIEDAKFLQDMVQLTTGINDNILGQFYTGRRSATEARNVNSSAAARLKMLASLIFASGLEPMAQKMLSNLRDGLDEETIVKLSGIDGVEEIPGFKKITKKDLIGTYDFEIFDGTLPSEKNLIAQTLEQYLLALMKDPNVAVSLGIDPKTMLFEAMELRGIRNPKRFMLPPAPAGMQVPGQPPQIPLAGNGQQQLPPPNGNEPTMPDINAPGQSQGAGFGSLIKG